MTDTDMARRLLDKHGTTYAESAGIALRDEPSPRGGGRRRRCATPAVNSE